MLVQLEISTMSSTENSTGVAMTTGPTTPFFFPFLDEKARKITEIVMDYVVVFGIWALGVVTNTLVIIVYAK